MIRGYVQETGHAVVPDDDAFKRVLGFRAGDQVWHISLMDLQQSFVAEPERAEVFRPLFQTIDGRQQLAQSLSAGTLPG